MRHRNATNRNATTYQSATTTRVTVTAGELADRAAGLLAAGHRLALAAAHDDGDALRAVYLFTGGQGAAGRGHVELHLPMDLAEPTVPTLARLSFPAGRFEREMHDLYGVVPLDHPLPRRLVRHAHWPAGWYPMRRDAGPPPDFGAAGPFPFLTVEGPGVYEIPVGPVHAGMIEPGHFRFSVVGETILKLKARLWYVHRGVEKLFEGRAPAAGIPLAERISGDTAVGHTVAYCRAVEDALGLAVPESDEHARTVLLELERLYNHVGDLGALCNDVGHGILNAHALRIRERLLRLGATVTGHRLLRGAVRVGGAALRAVPERAALAAVAADVRDLVGLAVGNSLVAERFTGTAVLTADQARDLGTLGYVARASTDGAGDVMARFRQRAIEIERAIAVLDDIVGTGSARTAEEGWTAAAAADARGAGPLAGVGVSGVGVSGVGIAEGWRGTIVHRVELAADGTLSRVAVVDPSFFNWPALPVALKDTIVPDFPLANKSFNLSYAGNDL